MRKVNLLRCDIARDASMQDLFSELSDTRVALSQAYARFNAVCEPELVDACVYEINAELSRYDYLLRQINSMTPFELKEEQILVGTHGQYTPAIGAALFYVKEFIQSV